MNLSRSKAVAATAVVALALGGAMSPAMARGERAGHGGGGFHGGGFHGGGLQAGGGFHGGRHFAGGGFDHGSHGGFGGGGYYAGGNPGWSYGGGYYGSPYYGDYGYGYGYDGLGLGGFTAGLIGGALLGSEGPYYDTGNSIAYCESHFKSYNPATGTYLGYDGLRHACP